jgi:hypothetical protein
VRILVDRHLQWIARADHDALAANVAKLAAVNFHPFGASQMKAARRQSFESTTTEAARFRSVDQHR